MEGTPPPDESVPLGDAQVAADIARAARRGRGVDRSPTLEQLLAAFGEPEATERARRRVRSALELAGIEVRPNVLQAPAGERVLLDASGSGDGRSTGSRALLGLLALAAVVAVAAVAATLAGKSGTTAHDALPATTATTTPSALTTTTATPGAATAPAQPRTPAPAATTQTTPAAQTVPPSPTTPATQTDPPSQTTPRTSAPPPARRTVTVRVNALGRPSFVCADDGAGHQLFSGILSDARVFRGHHIRLNIGLASTRVKVNGKVVALDGSPAGLDISRRGARPLPLGQRPCA
jgi:hypothetical protein